MQQLFDVGDVTWFCVLSRHEENSAKSVACEAVIGEIEHAKSIGRGVVPTDSSARCTPALVVLALL